MAPVGRTASGVDVSARVSGVAGIGAETVKRGAQQLLDDAMFLTPRGVFARVNSVALAKVEQGVKCRSNRINRDILSRTDLKDAVSVVWDGYFILCFPSNRRVFCC